jgi:antitoxin ParD1/3/4
MASYRQEDLPMPTMNISLTDDLKQVVEKRIEDGRYSTASEYMRELIRADERKARLDRLSIIDPDNYHLLTDEQRAKAEEKLLALILEGMEGEPSPMTAQDWADIRAEGMALVEARKKDRNGEC